MNAELERQTAGAKAGAIPSASFAHPQHRRLLRQDVYEVLLDEFLEGVFVPGDRIRDDELAQRLGVSRTPVREALTRLGAAGLVDTAPNRYTRVAALVTPAVQEALEVLGTLYRLGVADVVENLDEAGDFELDLLCRRIEAASPEDAQIALEALVGFCAERLRMPILRQLIAVAQPQVLRVLKQRPEVLSAAGGLDVIREFARALDQQDAALCQKLVTTFVVSLRGPIEAITQETPSDAVGVVL